MKRPFGTGRPPRYCRRRELFRRGQRPFWKDRAHAKCYRRVPTSPNGPQRPAKANVA